MSKCTKCNGIGTIDNDRYWALKAEYGIEYAMWKTKGTIINCKTCKGLGFVVTDMPDIMHELRDIAITIPPNEQKRLKNVINIIESNF